MTDPTEMSREELLAEVERLQDFNESQSHKIAVAKKRIRNLTVQRNDLRGKLFDQTIQKTRARAAGMSRGAQ